MKRIQASKRAKRGPKFKFGERVPRTVREAYELDIMHKNTGWSDAIDKEITSLRDKYQCFDIREDRHERPPPNYQFIKLIWVFDVKFDGRKKARLVAGGHMTEKLEIEDVTSTMISLDSIKLLFIAGELQGLKCMAADVTSAYIQAYTREQVYTIAGPEFGKDEGKTIYIVKALYGLQTSGNEWHGRFADDLTSMGFIPSKADSDLWMKFKGDHYEYIGVFVDDILVFSKHPEKIIKAIQDTLGYDLKGIGPPEYYNGADMSFNSDTQNWELSARTYINNVCSKIESLFEVKLKNYGSPMEVGDHPEVDESDLLTPAEITRYQMLVGCAQWAVTIGRFDIQYATNTLARFAVAPREGHVKRMLRLFGYLKHHAKYRLAFDMDPPNYEGLEFMEHDWTLLYPQASEDLPEEVPTPVTREVTMTVYADSSHGNCLVTRRSTTGILLTIDKTVVLTYSKRQNTVESSTYGSEFVAG